MSQSERCASYVVSADRTFYVTTIIWRNELVGNYGSTESGIRDMTRHRDGYPYASCLEMEKVVSFVLCQHDIWPLEAGHKAVVDALKLGVKPDDVWDILEARRRDD